MTFEKWAIGIVTLWVFLSAMAEVDSLRALAVAFAWATVIAAFLARGIPAMQNLDKAY